MEQLSFDFVIADDDPELIQVTVIETGEPFSVLSANDILKSALRENFAFALVIGRKEDGNFNYFTNDSDPYHINYALDRCKRFIMRQLD